MAFTEKEKSQSFQKLLNFIRRASQGQ